jgi:hypothetical protein
MREDGRRWKEVGELFTQSKESNMMGHKKEQKVKRRPLH